jgi:hypothetical protein
MITVRVFTLTGNSWVTSFNGTFAEAKAYFVGRDFERGDETVDTIEKIELID